MTGPYDRLDSRGVGFRPLSGLERIETRIHPAALKPTVDAEDRGMTPRSSHDEIEKDAPTSMASIEKSPLTKNTEKSLSTLISISGTMASIGLAVVGILASRPKIVRSESIADDIFLFASLGFVFVLAMGYVVQRDPKASQVEKLVTVSEWLFSGAMLAMLVAAFILVYAEV